MIAEFEDFCLYVLVIVDDFYQQIEPLLRRPGPKPVCSDSELIAMSLIGECRGWDVETELLSHMQEHRDLFPHIPSQSRFNRRRRQLMWVINLIRQMMVAAMDIGQDRQCIIDSVPVPVVQFYLVPGSTGDWAAHGASFGKVPSRKETIYGYKLHLLITFGGVIRDFVLAPANATDLQVGEELLDQHTDLTVLGDKGYISAAVAARLLATRHIALLTLPRKNQKRQVSRQARKLFNTLRQMIETVNGQLSEQFHLQVNHAHTFYGLCARLYTKLAAHTLCIYINRLLGEPDFLQIKSLAFPI
jgi:hypothetical protein